MKVVFVLMVMAISMGSEGEAYLQPNWVILPIDGNPYPTMTLCLTAKSRILEKKTTSLAGIQFTKIGCLRKEIG